MHNEISDTAEYLILENIYASSPRKTPLKQRELAQITRTSLGMTNSILKRLTQKGWISIKKLNSRNIRYALTLDGLDEIIKRSYRYFKRTINNIAFYRDTIDAHIQKAVQEKINTVVLTGYSDLEFIVEHCCHRRGISFLKSSASEIANEPDASVLTVFPENIPLRENMPKCLFLSELLLKPPVISAEY